MESPVAYPESPLEADEAAYPCKGCGEILEEGKAFELAGHRWHIDCFRCNTCGTLLDSDANLLLLGDGSLICNNCTYSCSNCGNKIEDLAILTGDQAFCATCFKCRNCKKKIENLRYARTSQGIFCMDCHEALMARRRKKTARNAAQRQKLTANNSAQLDKSLPSLPPSDAAKHAFLPSAETLYDTHPDPPSETPNLNKQIEDLRKSTSIEKRDRSPGAPKHNRDNLTLPATAFHDHRHSVMSQRSEQSGLQEFLIPVAFDPHPADVPSPQLSNQATPRAVEERPRDYFNARSASGSRQNNPISAQTNNTSSPHITSQEKGRQTLVEPVESKRKRIEGSTSRSGSTTASPHIPPEQSRAQPDDQLPHSQLVRDSSAQAERFKLQEAPRTKRSGNSTRSSASETMTSRAEPSNGTVLTKPPTTPTIQEPGHSGKPAVSTPPTSSYEYSPVQSAPTESPKPMQHPATGQLQALPKRGDSLDNSKRNKTIPRKELNAAATIPQAFSDVLNKSTSSTPNPENVIDLTKANGGRIISKPIESPNSRSIFDTPNLLNTSNDGVANDISKGSFVTPRVPPLPPHDPARSRNDSTGVTQAEMPKTAEHHASPSLPRYSAGGEFTMEEDMARILAGDESSAQDSFLRRVSNSVRHGRSYSDKGGRMSREQRWPRSPQVTGTVGGQEISSPNTASPENRDEISWFKNELRRERQKTVEREKKIAELESALDSTANVKQVNEDLREKRSTMVVLDAQKEIVVRELEVLTQHIAAAKNNGEPLDLSKMSSTVLREFAEALQKLKDSFTPQIEESIQKRNSLVDEIANLTQMKDKSFQEFEQLSSKNAQLAELNNQLVHQIQGLYKANAGPNAEPSRSPHVANGLGIYSHHKDKSQMSFDSRMMSDLSVPSTATTLQPEEAEPVTVLQGPHVVSIRKGQAKKFNWKKEGRNVAKGVTKGIKGAFSSTQQSYNRDLHFAETQPYGSAPIGQEYSSLPRNNQEPMKQGYGLFGNQKMPQRPNGLINQANSSTPSLQLDPSTHLFGSDLEQRAEYEKNAIPVIVTRCIEEVDARGLDVEGIYRKSGGNSQVQAVRDGFENSPSDVDLSDPDLDIHAVTSGLKQYFRRLPIPLITYEVYDKLLETTMISEPQERVEAMSRALSELPRVHYEVLEYLMGHLKRVVEQEKENLMTSLNVAVVFAPTIMRPESLGRELSDTKMKNDAVMWMVDHCDQIFGSD